MQKFQTDQSKKKIVQAYIFCVFRNCVVKKVNTKTTKAKKQNFENFDFQILFSQRTSRGNEKLEKFLPTFLKKRHQSIGIQLFDQQSFKTMLNYPYVFQ